MNWRAALDRPGARSVRLVGVALVAVAASVAAVEVLVPLAVRGLVRGVELLANACVWFAVSLSVGMSVWSVLAVVGRTIAGLMTTPQVSAGLAVLVLIG